jgi:hypothetical protein
MIRSFDLNGTSECTVLVAQPTDVTNRGNRRDQSNQKAVEERTCVPLAHPPTRNVLLICDTLINAMNIRRLRSWLRIQATIISHRPENH